MGKESEKKMLTTSRNIKSKIKYRLKINSEEL